MDNLYNNMHVYTCKIIVGTLLRNKLTAAMINRRLILK